MEEEESVSVGTQWKRRGPGGERQRDSKNLSPGLSTKGEKKRLDSAVGGAEESWAGLKGVWKKNVHSYLSLG